MEFDVVAIQPLIALIAGILILIIPRLLNIHRCAVFDSDRTCGDSAAFQDGSFFVRLVENG